MTDAKTRERQYQFQVTLDESRGRTPLGIMINAAWDQDPRRMLFMLARYKFVAKMFKGKKRALEVGCGDAFGTRLVLQDVESLTAVDFDPVFVQDVNARMTDAWKFDCRVHDMVAGPVTGTFDAVFSLDVIEHIQPADEKAFLQNMVDSLADDGALIVGTPSIQSQPYASPASKEGHVNCKDGEELRALMGKWFENVFLFSMNDEVVHTGYHPMAHYLFVLCCGKRDTLAEDKAPG